MSKPRTAASLRPNKLNPRRITDPRLAKLKRAMAQFGDLGGIVRNVHPDAGGKENGTLIGGHQRIQAYRDDPDAVVVLEREYAKPTSAGTVAEGYVLIRGEKFAYRETLWTETKAKAALLASNKHAAEFDVTGLTAIINDLAASEFDLELTMFDEGELNAYLPDEAELAAFGAPEEFRYDSGEDETDDDGDEAQQADGKQSPQPAIPENLPVNNVKMVQLFYSVDDHKKFIELTNTLKEVYHRSNLSDTVLEAIKRASITAALK